MPKEQLPGSPITRRYSEEEKAAAVRMVRTLGGAAAQPTPDQIKGQRCSGSPTVGSICPTSLEPVLIHDHITDALKVPDLIRLSERVVLARSETLKIYATLGAVRELMRRGTIHPGQTLIDSSSGIYALALAFACHRYGFKCRIVASTSVTSSLRAQLKMLGVTVDQMPPTDNLRLDQSRRVKLIRQLLAADPNMYWMRQYHDPVHCLGYAEFAHVVRNALPTGHLSVVAGVGTGASSAGLIESLREDDPSVHLCGDGGGGRIHRRRHALPEDRQAQCGCGTRPDFAASGVRSADRVCPFRAFHDALRLRRRGGGVLRLRSDEFHLSCGGGKESGWLRAVLDEMGGATIEESPLVSFNIKGYTRLAAVQQLLARDSRDRVGGLGVFQSCSVYGLSGWTGTQPLTLSARRVASRGSSDASAGSSGLLTTDPGLPNSVMRT